ncbi:hypothetical protein BpHYR1_031027 [Brachionus plicatilis]|uniref:Uncharacterized protein n=1 Tax=Brachionus plicatilis TaxID=10195 RepID=A0A3M7PIR1_BRAPC|nr:hypothetical protein BpHYR1_031027 [Brachionus plicatilis]
MCSTARMNSSSSSSCFISSSSSMSAISSSFFEHFSSFFCSNFDKSADQTFYWKIIIGCREFSWSISLPQINK